MKQLIKNKLQGCGKFGNVLYLGKGNQVCGTKDLEDENQIWLCPECKSFLSGVKIILEKEKEFLENNLNDKTRLFSKIDERLQEINKCLKMLEESGI